MKLYLSSYRIPDIKKFTDFVGKDAEAIRFENKGNKGVRYLYDTLRTWLEQSE